MNAVRTILLVDDDAVLSTVLETILSRGGYSVLCATSAHQALDLLAAHDVAAVITDLHMPRMKGDALLAHIAAAGKSLPAILITGSGESSDAYAHSPGVSAVLVKPIQRGDLLAALANILP